MRRFVTEEEGRRMGLQRVTLIRALRRYAKDERIGELAFLCRQAVQLNRRMTVDDLRALLRQAGEATKRANQTEADDCPTAPVSSVPRIAVRRDG